MTTVTRPALLSAVAYIMQAAGITLHELAQHQGHDLQQAPAPSRQPVEVLGDQALQVVALASRPQGAITADVQELLSVRHATASHHLERLTRMGKLTKAKAVGERGFRYFSTAEAAHAYTEDRKAAADQAVSVVLQERQLRAQQAHAREVARLQQQADRAEVKRKRAAGLVVRAKPTTPPKIDDSRMRPQGEAIETEATLRTIDSARRPNSRIEAAPVLPPDPRWPSFSSAPLGVNPDTGRAWA